MYRSNQDVYQQGDGLEQQREAVQSNSRENVIKREQRNVQEIIFNQ